MATNRTSASAPIPTIQWHADSGPILRYNGLTAAQVEALDLLAEDDRTGSSWTPGASVRRTRGGRFNVRATIDVVASGDGGYQRFRALLIDAAEVRRG